MDLRTPLAMSLILVSLNAGATIFQTTVDFSSSSPSSIPATRLVFDWETKAGVVSGTIGTGSLESLSLSAYDGTSDFYSDTMIAAGTAQPIGTLNRTITWDFDLDTGNLLTFNNDAAAVQGSANQTGENYHIYI